MKKIIIPAALMALGAGLVTAAGNNSGQVAVILAANNQEVAASNPINYVTIALVAMAVYIYNKQ